MALPLREAVQGVVFPASRGQELGDDLRIEDGLAGGDPRQRVHEVAHVGDAVLEQIADSVRARREQLRGESRLDVLGEDQNAGSVRFPAQEEGRAQTLVGEGGRQADVDHGDIGPMLGHGRAQRVAVAHGGHHVVTVGAQQLGQAIPQDDGVFGDDDAHGQAAHRCRGRSTVTAVGPPGGLWIIRCPSTVLSRSASPARPPPGRMVRRPPRRRGR
ncbi:hypothetical protein Pta02_73580 [Planobispora takensis]|uniref:Uncharacterized protein n=1 Tax=Planobispora takensis TaxID=1367882 RepID=A0A8J3WXL1_9ACTN|nr:hypothetical protein Pta02_73580 [Planobispora takensis]